MANSKDNYQSMSTELDQIVESLQDGSLEIDQAAKAYEKGIELINKLEDHLKTVENKISKIKNSFEK